MLSQPQDGPAPWLADFGLIECDELGYVARRRRNVADADTIILIGDLKSLGSIGVMKDWGQLRKYAAYLTVTPGGSTPRSAAGFLRSLRRHGKMIETVLVAGNRESKFPGIGQRAEWFSTRVFTLVARG